MSQLYYAWDREAVAQPTLRKYSRVILCFNKMDYKENFQVTEDIIQKFNYQRNAHILSKPVVGR